MVCLPQENIPHVYGGFVSQRCMVRWGWEANYGGPQSVGRNGGFAQGREITLLWVFRQPKRGRLPANIGTFRNYNGVARRGRRFDKNVYQMMCPSELKHQHGYLRNPRTKLT